MIATTPEVHVIDSTRRQAKCGCGWEGKLRVLLAKAKLDGFDHTTKTLHQPAMPYVIDPRKKLAL